MRHKMSFRIETLNVSKDVVLEGLDIEIDFEATPEEIEFQLKSLTNLFDKAMVAFEKAMAPFEKATPSNGGESFPKRVD